LMAFTVADFHDLIRLLEEHPDWQTELRRVLFSQDLLDLPRTVQELATAQHRTEEAITRLTERMEQGFAGAATERYELRQDLTQLTGRVDQLTDRVGEGFADVAEGRQRIRDRVGEGFADAAEDRQRIRDRVGEGFTDAAEDRQRIRDRMEQGFTEVVAEQRDMRRDIGQLKGLGREQFYRDRAAAIFGRLLRQGYDATNQVADRLQEARQTGMISDRDYQEALAADLLWGGQTRDSRQSIVLVLEASWTVGHIDVDRAARRAAVLRQAGLRALPVAAGQEWPPNMQDDARRSGVAIVQDGTVDQESWEAALAQA
jgi:predicted Rdx family selenoprotein